MISVKRFIQNSFLINLSTHYIRYLIILQTNEVDTMMENIITVHHRECKIETFEKKLAELKESRI